MTKKDFVEGALFQTLSNANLDVAKLELGEDETFVNVTFKNGYSKKANIECDSFGAIILDVTRAAMY